jgi:hypothetical protein
MAEAVGVSNMTAYFFSAQIPLDVGLGKFWITVDKNDGSQPLKVDNNGKGFVIEQDTLLHDPDRSFYFLVPPQEFNDARTRLVLAVSVPPGLLLSWF